MMDETARNRIEGYVAQLNAYLRYAPVAERSDICANAREQLEAAYAENGMAGLEAALAGMAPPSSYATAYPAPPPAPLKPYCKYYWAGLVCVGLAWWIGSAALAGAALCCVAAGYYFSGRDELRGIGWGKVTVLLAMVFLFFLPKGCTSSPLGNAIKKKIPPAIEYTDKGTRVSVGLGGITVVDGNQRVEVGLGGVKVQDGSNVKEPARIVDDVDLPFEADERILGTWKSVDFCDKPTFFNPKRPVWKGRLFVKGLMVEEGGRCLWRLEKGEFPHSWTRGFFINKVESTASHYFFRDIGGQTYLFVQWKSGDYTLRGMTPHYYVLTREQPMAEAES